MSPAAIEVRLSNPRADRVRSVHRLARRVVRSRTGLFVAEGPQAVREAIAVHVARGQLIRDLYVTEQAADRYPDELRSALRAGVSVCGVSDAVMAALTDTVSPQGLLAVCRTIDVPLAEAVAAAGAAGRVALIAVLAQVRDPGNAGTVLRAADAAGAGAVLVTDASVDVHNPKCVRSTAGSLFHPAVAQGATVAATVAALRGSGILVLAADGAGEHDLDDLLDDAAQPAPGTGRPLLTRPTAWLFGNEAWGLPAQVRDLADAVVRVPLRGRAESLNLAMAATVCLFASARAHSRGAVRRSFPPVAESIES